MTSFDKVALCDALYNMSIFAGGKDRPMLHTVCVHRLDDGSLAMQASDSYTAIRTTLKPVNGKGETAVRALLDVDDVRRLITLLRKFPTKTTPDSPYPRNITVFVDENKFRVDYDHRLTYNLECVVRDVGPDYPDLDKSVWMHWANRSEGDTRDSDYFALNPWLADRWSQLRGLDNPVPALLRVWAPRKEPYGLVSLQRGPYDGAQMAVREK